MAVTMSTPPPPPPGARMLETTASLLALIRQGDTAARDRLLSRSLPALQRWAHGRLPSRARDLSQTDDLVQKTLMKALSQLDTFEPRWEGAFMAYLRRGLLNNLKDEVKRAGRRPEHAPLDPEMPESAPSPLEVAIGRDKLEAYEAALSSMRPRPQEALVLMIEMQFSVAEIAEAMGWRTVNGARMYIKRALLELAKRMDVEHGKEDHGPLG
jgi:RNA polymerase sigma factor (sigma-70 family)